MDEDGKPESAQDVWELLRESLGPDVEIISVSTDLPWGPAGE